MRNFSSSAKHPEYFPDKADREISADAMQFIFQVILFNMP